MCMIKSIIKLNLLLLGISHIYGDISTMAVIVGLLAAITLTALNQYFDNKIFTWVSCGVFGVVCFAVPILVVFLPPLIFDMAGRSWPMATLLVIPVLAFEPLFIPVIIGVFLLEFLWSRWDKLVLKHTKLQDTHTEQNRNLTQKTKELQEKQHEAARLVKLSERNRIARDIHDNIGHVLSRAILQTGALQALNKDAALTEPLKALQDTLTGSMGVIRESIHDLKDDSIDLKQEMHKIFENTTFKVSIHYDMPDTNDVSNHVKNCFLMAAKETLTNAVRHSNASQISITLQEHPALYQLKIHDNGTIQPLTGEVGGMGLSNIEARVKNAGGYCSFGFDNGFKTFITLPKLCYQKGEMT